MIQQACAEANLSNTTHSQVPSNPCQPGTGRDNNAAGRRGFNMRGLATPTTLETASMTQQQGKTSMEEVKPTIFRDRHDAYTSFQHLSMVSIDIQDGESATPRKLDKLHRPLTRCLRLIKLVITLCKGYETKDIDQAVRVVSRLSHSLLQIILSLMVS